MTFPGILNFLPPEISPGLWGRVCQICLGSNQSRAARLRILNSLSLFRDLQKSTRFSGGGGGGRISVFSGTRPHSVGTGGSDIFRYLQLRNHISAPHRAIFVGTDTHFLLHTPKIRISC